MGWIRGKMLGGCSSINAMFYVQGNSADYQRWYDAGNKEWSVDEVRRCFKKSESLQNDEMLSDPKIRAHYGHNGPLVINKFNSTFRRYTDKVMEAWEEIGFRNVPDLNIENVMTSGLIPGTAANGVRQSTDRAFLLPIAGRTNLKILKRSLVTKVLVTKGLKAYGVEMEKDGKKYTFYATREVVVSAGAIASPQLLMLSGIGPVEHLREKNIPCVVNSPKVGQDLQDHCVVPIFIHGDVPDEVSVPDTHYDNLNYLVNRQGPLAQSDLTTDAMAFYSTDKNASYSNCQTSLTIFPKNKSLLSDTITKTFRYKEKVVDSIVEANKNRATYLLIYNLLHPESKGNISLSSNNPKDSPLIHPNYLSDPRDLETVVKGLKMATKIVNTKYFKSIGGFLGRLNIPACNKFFLDSEEYWRCVSINLVSTLWHPVRTCQMGTDIGNSVVDSRLRVHGVKGLRVVDASVMPNTVSGNTNAASIMIGERGSELIIEDNTKCGLICISEKIISEILEHRESNIMRV